MEVVLWRLLQYMKIVLVRSIYNIVAIYVVLMEKRSTENFN